VSNIVVAVQSAAIQFMPIGGTVQDVVTKPIHIVMLFKGRRVIINSATMARFVWIVDGILARCGGSIHR